MRTEQAAPPTAHQEVDDGVGAAAQVKERRDRQPPGPPRVEAGAARKAGTSTRGGAGRR